MYFWYQYICFGMFGLDRFGYVDQKLLCAQIKKIFKNHAVLYGEQNKLGQRRKHGHLFIHVPLLAKANTEQSKIT